VVGWAMNKAPKVNRRVALKVREFVRLAKRLGAEFEIKVEKIPSCGLVSLSIVAHRPEPSLRFCCSVGLFLAWIPGGASSRVSVRAINFANSKLIGRSVNAAIRHAECVLR